MLQIPQQKPSEAQTQRPPWGEMKRSMTGRTHVPRRDSPGPAGPAIEVVLASGRQALREEAAAPTQDEESGRGPPAGLEGSPGQDGTRRSAPREPSSPASSAAPGPRGDTGELALAEGRAARKSPSRPAPSPVSQKLRGARCSSSVTFRESETRVKPLRPCQLLPAPAARPTPARLQVPPLARTFPLRARPASKPRLQPSVFP